MIQKNKWKKVKNYYDRYNRVKFVLWKNSYGYVENFYNGINPNEIIKRGEKNE